MSALVTLPGAEWSHHCYCCGNLFDAVGLDSPCPQCGNVRRRETISLDAELDEHYGIRVPDDWRFILAGVAGPNPAPPANGA